MEKELVTIMTRIGEKLIFICGDAVVTTRTGFNSILNLFKDDASKSHGIHTFNFDESDIVRSKLVKFIITKLKSLSK